ncbi:hypothetical protein [Corynebacterium ulcerans]|nr:hypothetical protein [Corynebacterium ulcerans]
MFTAIQNFLSSVIDLDLLSSTPKSYFVEGWDAFKGIFIAIKNFVS